MTLNQLRAFLAVVATGSLTAAAEELAVSQPSMSELIRRIEKTYGLPLFTRGARRMVLTAAGEELLPFAQKSVAAADAADRALQSLGSLSGGVASFGLLRNAAYYLLSDLARQFHEFYPQVRVRLVGQNSAQVAAAVAEGSLEAGLVVLPIEDAGLTVTPIARDEVLYATSEPSRLGSPKTTRQLAEAPLVLYDAHFGWDDPTRRQLADRARLEGLRLEALIEVEHVEAALELVAHGVGDTIISRAVAESPSCPAVIRTVPFAEPLYDTIALIQRESTILSPATQEMVRLARQALSRSAGAIP